MTIEVGKSAPPFTLSDSKGKKVSLKDFRGKNVIVYFYPRDNTPGCTKEAQSFRDLWRKIQDLDATVLGISPDSPESHDSFACEFDLPFPLLSDPELKVLTEYEAYGEKMMYGKKSMGVIRSTVWVGPDGKVKKHWRRVAQAGEHPAEVSAALKDQASSK